MSLRLEEIANWTIDDINVQILRALPKGMKFELTTTDTGWRASYSSDQSPEVIWAEEHYAMRVLLLSAFMWLWRRQNPSPGHPAWVPTPSRRLVPVRVANSDPETPDLDPVNIRSVYSAHARKMGKETG
jgi:hypothetical protein